MTNRVIPEAAVESAARGMHAEAHPPERWDGRPDHQQIYRARARIALEAAAPHLLAEAWEKGAVAGWKQSGEGFNAEYPDESTGECSVDLSGNPYR